MHRASDVALGAWAAGKCSSVTRPLRAESRLGLPRLLLPGAGFSRRVIFGSHLSRRLLFASVSTILSTAFSSWLCHTVFSFSPSVPHPRELVPFRLSTYNFFKKVKTGTPFSFLFFPPGRFLFPFSYAPRDLLLLL